MGEIADMMLDGTLCECCGAYIGRSQGFPGYCSKQCAQDRGAIEAPIIKVKCKKCGKRVKEIGLAQHMKDKHGI
jgi:endogenous inhibitor of DNA gyrase (YacG/DUF329 family)